MDGSQYCAFTAGEVAIAAIEEAGSTDPEDVNEALKNISYEDHIMAFPGPVEFYTDSENKELSGENKNTANVMLQVQNLSAVNVYPEEFAEATPKGPLAPK